jgi:transcriptional regulator with XRE-family HTH domain
MEDLTFKTPLEIQVVLGERIQRLRRSRNLDQRSTAEKAGISERALRKLEAGRGSTVETLVRVLKALELTDRIELLAPEPTTNPLSLLRNAKLRKRIRHPRQPPLESK